MAEQERGPRPAITPETVALRDLQTAVTDAQLALARRMAMHPTDLSAMEHVSFAPDPLGARELSERLGLSPSATTELVDRLERAGHLDRTRSAVDRRRIELHATPAAGTAVMAQLSGLLAALDAVVEGFDDEQRAVIRAYLERATAAYRAWTEDAGDA